MAIPSCCYADRQIFIPTGDKIPFQTMRLEYLWLNRPGSAFDAWAGFGVTKDFEAELQLERLDSNAAVGTFNLAYSFVSPITDTVPGLAIGVRDGLNRTEVGRQFYAAATYRVGTAGEAGADHLDATLGVGVGRRTVPFVGVMLPFSPHVHGLAEHDGQRATAGIEVIPFAGLGLRLMAQEHQTLISVRWSARF